MRSVRSRVRLASTAPHDVAARRAPEPAGVIHRHTELGGEHDVVAARAQNLAERFLRAAAIAVAVGGVDQRHAEVERLVHDGTRRGEIDAAAEVVAAEPDGRRQRDRNCRACGSAFTQPGQSRLCVPLRRWRRTPPCRAAHRRPAPGRACGRWMARANAVISACSMSKVGCSAVWSGGAVTWPVGGVSEVGTKRKLCSVGLLISARPLLP